MTGLTTRSTFVGVAPEVTEGVFVQPSASQLFRVVGLPVFTPAVEILERDFIKGDIGRNKPLHGMRSGTVEVTVELRSGGITALDVQQPEAHEFLLSAFGSFTNPDNGLIQAGATQTVIPLDTGEGANFAYGDICHINGETRFVKSVSVDTITLNQALDKSAPSLNDDFIGGYTYKPAPTGHQSLSMAIWYGNAWEARAVGCKVSSISFADVATGQIGKLTITMEVLDYDNVSPSSAPGPASFNSTQPPVWLGAKMLKDDVVLCANALDMSMENTVEFEECMTNLGGRNASFLVDRVITSTLTPLLDSANIQFWVDFRDNLDFELFLAGARVDRTTGDHEAGTAVGMYMPNSNFTGFGFGDQDNLVIQELPVSSHVSDEFGNDDLFLGMS